MKIIMYNIVVIIAVMLGAVGNTVCAETVNAWRGDAIAGDWNESYKWNLHHPPVEGEAALFREDNSVIAVNSTVQLDNGMHLYGADLLLKGNGNINLWSMIPHERTVNIPASSTGYANLTLCDNLSLNGRIALSAKGFGTSASKGTITLKDRSTVTGGLSIGNEGVGSGRVMVMDNATFRITNLELNTLAEKGGMAEIHIMGGTVRIETDKNLFHLLMEDPGRKIVLGDMGTLRIDSSLPIDEKKEVIKQLIAERRLIAAPGCRLSAPILQEEMMIARAEDIQLSTIDTNKESLITVIDNISTTPSAASAKPADPSELVKALHEELINPTTTVAEVQIEEEAEDDNQTHMAGYIVVFGAILLALRKPAG